MSKPKLDFDYSRFDNIDDSDDEDKHYPGFDRNLNIRVNRMDRERLDEEIDQKKKVLLEQGLAEQAEALERKRPIHVDNACHVVEERTIIQGAQSEPSKVASSESFSFSEDEYKQFGAKHAAILEEFAQADWGHSQRLLLKRGEILLDEYANSFYNLTALDEEMQGNASRALQLCHQAQILAQIHHIAEPAKRPPRDMVAAFFAKFDKDPEESNAAFKREVDQFLHRLQLRAAEKKKQQDEEKRKQEVKSSLRKEKLVDAMFDMSREERMGPGGLDPVDVFTSLPPEMQRAFKLSDVGLLQQVGEDMGEEEFEKHFQRCIDSGLWKE